MDIAYLPAPSYPKISALVVELKYNLSADTAMSQIKRRKYPERLIHYQGNMLLVAIDYDKDIPNASPECKHHKCIIEEA